RSRVKFRGRYPMRGRRRRLELAHGCRAGKCDLAVSSHGHRRSGRPWAQVRSRILSICARPDQARQHRRDGIGYGRHDLVDDRNAVHDGRLAMKGPNRRAGFTLLEVLLALGIATLLLAGLYVSMDVQIRLTDAGRVKVSDSVLARSLLQKIADDISV